MVRDADVPNHKGEIDHLHLRRLNCRGNYLGRREYQRQVIEQLNKPPSSDDESPVYDASSRVP